MNRNRIGNSLSTEHANKPAAGHPLQITIKLLSKRCLLQADLVQGSVGCICTELLLMVMLSVAT